MAMLGIGLGFTGEVSRGPAFRSNTQWLLPPQADSGDDAPRPEEQFLRGVVLQGASGLKPK